jgi:glycerol-3-phosphate dehydrogenase
MRLSSLQEQFDAVIVGGGVIGAGIARDAALRGLRVALVERADFGGGTTAGSTRLIHGGLRYLEMLDFRLVRMDLREREILLRIARHLVKPLPFLVPFYNRSLFYRAKLRAGMVLYDALSYDRSLPGHRFLSAAETLAVEPGLVSRGLAGAAMYYDAQVDSPERLTMENVVDAAEHGATALNYVEALGAIHQGGRIAGVTVRDALTGEEAEVRAKVVINASGPWFDRVAAKLAPHPRKLIRATKGVHLACDPLVRHAVVLFSPVDGRLMFAIPWLGCGWVGTTDTDFAGDPADADATVEDVDYLRRSTEAFLPAMAKARIHYSTSGVRALVKQPGAASESAVSRLHRITQGPEGLLSVLGGKITGYRAIAEEAVDALCRTLGVTRQAETADTSLPGARTAPSDSHLGPIYGGRAELVTELAETSAELAAPLAPDYPDIAAQVVYSVRSEFCRRVEDFLLRRSLLGFRPDQGAAAVEPVSRLMGRELDWSESQRRREVESYRARVGNGAAAIGAERVSKR